MSTPSSPLPDRPVIATPRHASLVENLTRLTEAFQTSRGLVRVMGVWMAGVVYWDAKVALGNHLWAQAECAACLLRRLYELKETGAERRESAALDRLFRELVSVDNGDDFLWGCHGTLLPRLRDRFARWVEECDPVMDPLSARVLQEAVECLGQQIDWYQNFVPVYSPGPLKKSRAWAAYITKLIAESESADGSRADDRPVPVRPPEWKEFAGFSTPNRDACFRTAWSNEVARNLGDSFAEKRLGVFYNHTQEMQFAESLAAILFDMPEMPWVFHHDLARHCVDEIRHTMMGCARLAQLGEDLRTFPMLLQNYSVRAKLEPIERFCLMTLVIEASSFEKKRANVQMFGEQGDEVSERYESYDIRDEMMHVAFGHTWVPIMLRVAGDPRSVNDLTNHCRDILNDALKGERSAG